MTNLISDDHLEILLRLVAAMAAGMVVGLNRDLHDKPMGMRTLGLVSLATALVIIAGSAYGGGLHFREDAVSRVIQGMLTGIGFLGAGVILRERDNQEIHGLTTAATVVVAAAFGVAAGLGAWFLTLAGTGLALALLVFGVRLESLLYRALKSYKEKGSDEKVEPDKRR